MAQEFGDLFEKVANKPDLSIHVREVVLKLTESLFKSASKGKDRGEFAKGREQMAMHAIALLLEAKDWKQIERILFGDGNGE